MTKDSFDLECDRLSKAVDETMFEHLRWSRTEGPMLARLSELARTTLEDRSEFELTEEGASADIKRFVLKVHNNRVMAIAISLDSGRAVIQAEPIERGKYTLREGPPISDDYRQVDQGWMAAALKELFSRVQS